ncbi:MAG: hypothetical protein E7555_04510 [Ruminococcaceae bacterium]|nr:hypothetical protein [Oscillospiraceae bacterium]
MLFWIVFALCIAVTAFFTIKRTVNVKYSDLAVKICASSLFVATAIAAIISNPDVNLTVALMVVMGGVFGVLGDVFIELKWLQKEGNDTFFNLGFVTFMIQHIILVAAVFITYPMSLVNALICFTAPVVVLVASVGLTKVFRMEMGKFKVIANAYGALASMTFSVGFMTMINHGMELSQILFFAGGISFFASDLILSQIFFVKGKCTRLRVVLNHITYYGAQILIASSLFFMK